MGVRLSMSYSSLARTNGRSHIGLTAVTAGRRFWVWNRYADASSGAAAQSSVRIAITTAMGSIVIITKNTAELIRDVGSAVLAR